MHARPTRPRLTKSIKMSFHNEEFDQLERAAGDSRLRPLLPPDRDGPRCHPARPI